jgi:hypothetical protein
MSTLGRVKWEIKKDDKIDLMRNLDKIWLNEETYCRFDMILRTGKKPQEN